MDIIISKIQSVVYAFGPFIILLGFLIFVHELGHFLVAKWCGVRVEVFSLGFGKKILQYKRGDTNYCISLIPLGGYVKMFGDELGSQIEEKDRAFSFTHKKLWQRFAVVLAGPMMNCLFAILIFSVVGLMGEEVRRPVLGDILEGSAAFSAGFRSGDEILAVNSSEVKTWDQFQELLDGSVNSKTNFTVKRNSSEQTVAVEATPTLKANENLLSMHQYIGDVDGFSQGSKAAYIGVVKGSQAEVMGLMIGDRIISINSQPVNYFRELENLFIVQQGKSAEIEIERGLDKDAKIMKVTGTIPPHSSLGALGIESPDLYLAKIIEDSPAAIAGLLPGDKIVRVSTVEPKKWEDVLNTVKNYKGEGTVQFGVVRQGQEKLFDIVPKMASHMNHQGGEEKRFTIGIMPWIQNAPPALALVKTSGFSETLAHGWKKTYDITGMTILSFVRLIQGSISPKNIGGVLSIGQAASETFKTGLNHFLQLMAVISVNLFVINLFPVPVLDGGHLLFYAIEGLRGAPLSMRKMEIAQQVGLVVLMSLMALSLFNDVTRLFGF